MLLLNIRYIMEVKLFDFNVYTGKRGGESGSDESDSGSESFKKEDETSFMIQAFGINEKRETFNMLISGFKPYFYAKVDDKWSIKKKERFVDFLRIKLGKYYEDSISDCKLIAKRKLYGFDGGKKHKFVRVEKPQSAGTSPLYGENPEREKYAYDPPLPTSVLPFKSERGKHKTQKPITMMNWILKYYSKENDVVLDPTMGSGSMGVACKEMNRDFIGIELDEEIYKSACERLCIE